MVDESSGILLDNASVISLGSELEVNDGSFLLDVPAPSFWVLSPGLFLSLFFKKGKTVRS
ncbi:hypothetical protein [Alteromonas sp. 14N.309.X.WAT.G.H12]|uniref:hypothetical protein n=1 Tax=Alteromonas sp. 14N.309.X.WAT.G.H12 TaxID=3120824 RepID=UPI002FD156DB